MKTIIGSVIGALSMGVLLIGFNGAGSAGQAQVAPVATTNSTYGPARLVSEQDQLRANDALFTASGAAAGPVLVKCEPNQQALLRETRGVNGEAVKQVECVSSAPASSAVYVDQYGRTMAVPAANVVTSDIVSAPRPVRTVYQAPAPARRTVYRQSSETARSSGRSWKKSALIIGGSAATGAGVGAIAGGKKGAGIGAAIGGGAATLWEALKR